MPTICYTPSIYILSLLYIAGLFFWPTGSTGYRYEFDHGTLVRSNAWNGEVLYLRHGHWSEPATISADSILKQYGFPGDPTLSSPR